MSKVLLVDKDTTRVTSIRQALERGGFETVSAEDGNEALKTFLNEVPDLVMVGPIAAQPDESFCHRMRETRPGTTIPILFYCEALGPAALKSALERSGCNVYVEMPASDERLVEVCRHALLESVGHGSRETPEPGAAEATPAFATPGAAMAQLNTSGSDIDAHLEALFEMGDIPVGGDVPAVSLEAEISDLPLGPAISEPDPAPMATMADQISGPADADADAGNHEGLDSGHDLVGFQPDAVSFESEGEVNPGIQPEIASEAESLIQSPYGSPAADVAAPVAFSSDAMTADASSVGSLDLDMDEAPAAEGTSFDDMQPAPRSTSASRGWLWGIVVAAIIGGVGLFFVLRPAPADGAGSENLASMQPTTPAPTIRAATDPGNDVIDVDPLDAEVPDVVPALDPAGAIDDPVAETAAPEVETPEDAASVAVEPEEAAIAAAEDTPPETRAVNTEPPTVAAVAPSPDEAPVDPGPAPSAGMVFQPSTEIVDPATAGEGFTAPRSIDRVEPTYDPQDVLDGGETVVLRVLVNDWGKAVRVEIEKGRANSPLVNAAIDAVLNTRFHAAELRGRQVRAWITETFEFE